MDTSEDTRKVQLELLRSVVAAKVRYWDAFRKLELELCGDDFSDRANDAIHDVIELLAVGIDSPSDVSNLTYTELDHVLQLAKVE